MRGRQYSQHSALVIVAEVKKLSQAGMPPIADQRHLRMSATIHS
jgi:hypothetical protein